MTIWNELFRLFYPALCVSCGRPLVRGEDQICIRCLSDLPVYHPSAEKHFEQIAAICPYTPICNEEGARLRCLRIYAIPHHNTARIALRNVRSGRHSTHGLLPALTQRLLTVGRAGAPCAGRDKGKRQPPPRPGVESKKTRETGLFRSRLPMDFT